MAGSERIYSIIISVLFLLLISIVLLNQRFHFYAEKTVSVTENRNLARKPVFKTYSIDLFPKQFEPYFNDHFPFRQEMMKEYTIANYLVFRKSPHPDVVEIGKDNWLYHVFKEKELFAGGPEVDPVTLPNIRGYLKMRTEWHKKHGIKLYIAVFPLKPEIYPEFLPPDFNRGKNPTIAERLKDLIKDEKDLNFIDVKPALLKAKSEGRLLYKKTDTHWTELGAYIAYREIINRIKKDFPKVRCIEEKDFSFKKESIPPGNLATMIGLNDYFSDEEYFPVIKNATAKDGKKTGYILPGPPDPTYEIVRETGDTFRPKVLVFRDSYTLALMPYLDESFSKTTYIFDQWEYDFHSDIVLNEKPDIVLMLIYEAYIMNLQWDSGPIPQ